MSHYTPEFQKYSLGLGKKCLTCFPFPALFLKLASNIILPLLSGLAPSDLETFGQTGNGGPDGLNAEAESIDVGKDIKDEATAINKPKHVLTTFEMEGLWNLLGKLEELPDHKKCAPDGIRDPSALLNDMRVGAHPPTENSHWSRLFCRVLMFASFLLIVQAVLRQCALDDPKLSYTGEPIVKWPERVSGNSAVTTYFSFSRTKMFRL